VVSDIARRHRQSCRDPVERADLPTGARLSPTAGGRIYASPAHLRSVCPSSRHVYCDKYDTAGAHWFDAAASSGAGNQLCWNQTIKFLAPSDDELLAAHEPYAVDRSWTAVAGTDPVAAVNL